MNLSEAKTLIELIHPSIKQIAEAAMESVAEACGDALKQSRENTDRQLQEIIKRLEALENRG